MKRKKITLKKKVVATIKPKQLKTVTGGWGGGSGSGQTSGCSSDGTRTCPRW